MEKIFTKHNPAYPFEYEFVDEEFNEKIQISNLVNKIVNLVAGVVWVSRGWRHILLKNVIKKLQ